MVENTKPLFIVDASFVMAFIMPDEDSEIVESVFEKLSTGLVVLLSPDLLRYEISNSFRNAVLRGRSTAADIQLYCDAFEQLDLQMTDVPICACLDVAIQENISCYDASYLWLAREKQVPLLTFDRKLKKIADKYLGN